MEDVAAEIGNTAYSVTWVRLRQRPTTFFEPTRHALYVLLGRFFADGAHYDFPDARAIDVPIRSFGSMLDRERHHLVDLVIAQSTTQDG
ncbi:hypothetical protein BH686_01860 [Rhodococcus erythropolis]|nr:hypothetical protein BH686_01860 [Rhodococcus erythropolis]